MNHTIGTQNFELLLPLRCPAALSKVEEGNELHSLISNDEKNYTWAKEIKITKRKIMWQSQVEENRFLLPKNAVLWDVTPCGSCENQWFSGKCRLYHQREMNQQVRKSVSSN
jgi:hypothetical protein